jgi:hypothetical protein
MATVTMIRELWRRRFLVAGVAVIAVLAGILVLYQISFPPKLTSRKYNVGVATASILVDTPHSQVADVAPKGSDTLGVRANLLASLMVDGAIKTNIAQAAGLNPNNLFGVSKSVTDQPAGQPKSPQEPVLTTQVVTENDGSDLPIIVVQAQARNAAAAGSLANAAVVGLRNYLGSTAASQRIPDANRLQITNVGVPQAATATRGPSVALGFGAAIVVFVLGCACILGSVAFMRSWRAEEAGQPVTAWVTRQAPAPTLSSGLASELAAARHRTGRVGASLAAVRTEDEEDDESGDDEQRARTA